MSILSSIGIVQTNGASSGLYNIRASDHDTTIISKGSSEENIQANHKYSEP